MKITAIKSLGIKRTYSPEMESDSHNYITEQSNAVHRNSHAISYCLVALRCLWLKAHFAPEFWACVMSGCHPDKIPRYMSVSRSEGWTPTEITYSGKYKPAKAAQGVKFGTLNINCLTKNYTVTGDVVNQGMIGVKGIGDKAADIFEGEGDFKSIDHFIYPNVDPNTLSSFIQSGKVVTKEYESDRKNKAVIERLIKLGAFAHLPQHENAKALWMYYQFHYCSDTDIKKQIKADALAFEGWNDKTIYAEQQRQITEYKKLYPKRNKIPAKIMNWQPSPPPITLSYINKLYPTDYYLSDKLQFQKDYLGFYLDSPLELFETRGNSTIKDAKTLGLEQREVMLEVMITAVQYAMTKPKEGQENGTQYAKVSVTDGIQNTLVFIWKSELDKIDPNVLKSGVGIRIRVNFDSARNTFSLCRNTTIRCLRLKDAD